MRKTFMIKIPKVVFPLIAINVFIFILQSRFPIITKLFVLDTSNVFLQPWTLVTSMFLHGGFNHILFNVYALLMFGPLIEQRIGSRRFLEMYFLSGILASVGFVFFQEVILGVSDSALGASGAIMGVLGMTIMLLPQLRVLFFFIIPMSMRTAGMVFAFIDLLGVFGVGVTGIANISHLVGLGVGLLYAKKLLTQKKNYYKEFAKPYKESASRKEYSKTIELSDEDVENYLKKGRL